jgi:transitional endoplasmic reticulum ATPase
MPEAQLKDMQKSMAAQKVGAYVSMAQKNEGLQSAFVVFIATLLLLSAIPFYPIYIDVVLAAIAGAIAYKMPSVGVIVGTLFGLPAVMYQSAVFAWAYFLYIVAIQLTVFDDWQLVAALEIFILAPFAFGRLPFAGWISMVGMGIGALHFGSKKSLTISLVSVAMILLLSSVWLVDNTAYMPLNMKNYQPGKAELQFTRGTADVMDLGNQMGSAIGNFLDFANISRVWESAGWIAGNAVLLITNDSLILQVFAWGIALFLVGILPTVFKTKSQLIASLAMLVLIPAYYLIGMLYGTGFRFEFVGGIILTIATLGGLEHFGISVSREAEINRKDKMKSYGKFGMTDMSAGGMEKGMDDVGGYEDVKQELRDAIMMPLQKKEIAFAYGLTAPKGILLFGPPGTGKTMLMRALAKELGYNFIEIRCSQILSQWYGESEKNVAEIFSNARKNAPTVLFFDELDSIGKKRSSMGEGLDTVGPRVLTTLLQEMDGASKVEKTVIVIGATNLPNELDPAILRPGRLDKIIYMHLPDPDARKAIFKVAMRKMQVAPDVDLDALVRKTERFSGADLRNVVEEAKKITAREAITKNMIIPTTMAHFQRVIDGVKPSTGLAQLDTFEQFRMDFERRTGAEKPKEDASAKEASVKWSDVVGLDLVKRSLLEAIELPLLHEKEMKEFKVKPSKGLLLFGPPGTGKTLIVKAAANELHASFQTLSAAELMKKGYTQAVGVIKETFNRARENPPGIIFVDEIETFAPARGMGGSSEILGQFLTEMDGIKGQGGVVIIGATNKPFLMDPAIMRPGRFDKIFYVPPPDTKGRSDMFTLYLGSFAAGVDVNMLAAMTAGFSGADIASLIQSAKMDALRSKLAGNPMAITTQSLMEVIKSRRASITPDLLEEYRKFIEAYGERK